MKAIYLTSPHGQLIHSGLKKLIIKQKEYKKMVNKPLLLVSKDKAYGIIKLEKPFKIGKKEFIELFPFHLVTEEELKEWNFRFPLFAYPFQIIKLFKKPKKVKVPLGVQTFFEVE